LFNHQQQHKSNKTGVSNQTNPPVTTTALSESSSSSSTTAPYVYIDHEKTTTLKDIAIERLQARRIET
jgi:hypothetical protein